MICHFNQTPNRPHRLCLHRLPFHFNGLFPWLSSAQFCSVASQYPVLVDTLYAVGLIFRTAEQILWNAYRACQVSFAPYSGTKIFGLPFLVSADRSLPAFAPRIIFSSCLHLQDRVPLIFRSFLSSAGRRPFWFFPVLLISCFAPINWKRDLRSQVSFLWWGLLGSNQWPHACQACALTSWAKSPTTCALYHILTRKSSPFSKKNWIFDFTVSVGSFDGLSHNTVIFTVIWQKWFRCIDKRCILCYIRIVKMIEVQLS